MLRNLDNNGNNVVFKVSRGVTVFAFSETVNLIVTGGLDCLVRLWNPYVPNQPLAILKGHSTPIIMLAISPLASVAGVVVSVSSNESMKMWDIQDQACTTSLTSIIPHRLSLGNDKSEVTKMLWHDGSQSMLCAAREELSVVQVDLYSLYHVAFNVCS